MKRWRGERQTQENERVYPDEQRRLQRLLLMKELHWRQTY